MLNYTFILTERDYGGGSGGGGPWLRVGLVDAFMIINKHQRRNKENIVFMYNL